MTVIEQTLQKLALENWELFAELIGDEAIRDAKICLLHQGGFSYGAISNKLGITKRQAQLGAYRCCPDSEIITITIENFPFPIGKKVT